MLDKIKEICNKTSCDIETFNEKFDFGKPYNSQDDDIEYFREIRKI